MRQSADYLELIEPPGTTRDRIVTEALKLFSEKGYRGTRVGDIEAAAGLSPRSGALYSHFASKEEVFAAALDRVDAAVDAAVRLFEMSSVEDLRSELTLLGRGMFLAAGMWDRVIGIMLKEAEQFPELVGQARARVLDRAHVWLADWLRRQVASRRLVDHDQDAVAAIAIGSLLYHHLLATRFGGPPSEVEQDRFVAAWVDLIGRLATPKSKRRGGSR